ncbi:hypothetical protein D3C87_1431030 [compost metagenome]
MHVQVVAEGVHQAFVPGKVGHDPQLDLRIVRRQQFVAGRGHESLANAPPLGGAHRDVLQVRIAGRQTTGGRHSLVIRRVNPAGARVDLLRKAVGVGAFQLAHGTVFHQHFWQPVVILGQLGEHFFSGGWLALGGLLQHRQAEFLVENHTQLFR